MVKEVYFFTEMGYTAYPQEDARRRGYNNLMFPNEHFSPERAQQLYGMYFEELQYCTESGFDGVMINEHHNNPLSMMPSVNVIGAVLARTTRKGRIVFLGNVLPIHDNPLRIAEEVAMIDILSGGRVVCGFVRGLGQESLATNTNPAYNRERFDEAHDIVIKTWTVPGPWRWEGRHYQLRVVNPLVLPLQKPHPRVWIPGVASKETILWAAQHRYPYIALNTSIEDSKAIWKTYDEEAGKSGYKGGPEQRGYLIRCHVQEDEEKALKNARQFMWMMGEFTGLQHPVWAAPSGYLGPWARRALAEVRVGRRKLRAAFGPFEDQ